MKKITIKIEALPAGNGRIDPPGSVVAWELICLSKILSMPAYKDDERAIRNRLNWYEADNADLKIRIEID